MSFRLPFDLLDFDESFIAIARSSIGGVDWPTHAVHVCGVHPAVTQVGIVGDGQQFVAGLALCVHPLPKVLWMPRLEGGIGHLRNLGTITEEDVAMQVSEVMLRGVLVGA